MCRRIRHDRFDPVPQLRGEWFDESPVPRSRSATRSGSARPSDQRPRSRETRRSAVSTTSSSELQSPADERAARADQLRALSLSAVGHPETSPWCRRWCWYKRESLFLIRPGKAGRQEDCVSEGADDQGTRALGASAALSAGAAAGCAGPSSRLAVDQHQDCGGEPCERRGWAWRNGLHRRIAKRTRGCGRAEQRRKARKTGPEPPRTRPSRTSSGSRSRGSCACR